MHPGSMVISVGDVLGRLAAGMSTEDILQDFDEMAENDIYAALSFAADRENKTYQMVV